jgi:transaldolase
MKPSNLKTKIFLDSGDPKETREILDILGFLDGQTTNPSLIAKNPEIFGKRFSKEEILDFYKGVAREVSGLLPGGSVSIEVYADLSAESEEMLKQARVFNKWIPFAHIKFPTTSEGLKAAEAAVKEGIRVNMTLVFTEEQAAAVYAATRGAKIGDVFISPFVGRLDDISENGMDLIENILKMYENSDHHVEVLAASVRSVEHLLRAFELGSDIITAPLKVLKEWKEFGMPSSSEKLNLPAGGKSSNLKPIPYRKINLNKSWEEYNIHHELTDKGIERFAKDWNSLIG